LPLLTIVFLNFFRNHTSEYGHDLNNSFPILDFLKILL